MIGDRVVAWLTEEVRPRTAGASRRLLAFGALVSLVPLLPVGRQLVDAEALHLPRVDWLTLTGSVVTAIGVVWFVSAVAILFFESALASFGLAAAVSLAVVGDRQISGNYLLILVIVAIAHGSRLILGRAPSLRRVSDSPLRVVLALGPVVMAWTALAKLNPVFLSGAVLDAVLSNGILTIPVTLSPEALRFMALTVVGGEIALALGFLLPGMRRAACLGAMGFHLATVLLMAGPTRFLAFTLAMTTSYSLIWAWLPPRPGRGLPGLRGGEPAVASD